MDYKRGIGNYTKTLYVKPEWSGKRIFIRFEGANNVSNLFLNGKHIGEHRGGYGAFIFELTDKLNYGQENRIGVRVNNAEQLDIMPLVGDFNFYGGIYRSVHLLLTDELCISPLDHASPGVYLIQKQVSEKRANLCARIVLSNGTDQPQTATVRLTIKAGEKNHYEEEKEVIIRPKENNQDEELHFSMNNPHLWNGVADPFLYKAIITLHRNGKQIDRIEQPLGLRYYSTDPIKGFFLNGKHLPLRGVCRHQERAEVGNALHTIHHDEDTQLMLEMGVNAIRLAHYPQATYMYDLMDKSGIVVWAEIPFVGPGGYEDKGYVDQPSFRLNGKEQLKELIRQHYNHPSICFWGLFNELKEEGDNPVEYIKELNQLAHQEDPTRPTTGASNQNGAINRITDNIAWNRYDGWYGATPATLGQWLDKTHAENPQLKIGISEYGAGASIYHQQDTLIQTSPTAWWHPENWQTEYHIRNWKIIQDRPYIWGSFVWNMFDFGAAHRTEGDRPGVNDKGLVTLDRKIKKDAYFFYKANWNPEPMIYLAEHRNTNRTRQITQVVVFSNCAEVILKINGIVVGQQQPDEVRVCTFRNVRLEKGVNQIEVIAKKGKTILSDRCEWTL